VTNRQGSNDSAESRQDSRAASHLSAASTTATSAARQGAPVERLLLLPPGSTQSRATREVAMVSGTSPAMGYNTAGVHQDHSPQAGYQQHGRYHDGGGSSATAVQVGPSGDTRGLWLPLCNGARLS
jgi:hypothetical protein